MLYPSHSHKAQKLKVSILPVGVELLSQPQPTPSTATNGTGNAITVNGTSIANGSSATISSNQSGSTLAITAVAPAVNSDGNPLAPASKAIVGNGVLSGTDGTVTAGVNFTNFTGRYSRTS